MSDFGLGRFGDRRLEKGGCSCTSAWLRWADAVCGFAGLAEPVRERFGLAVFCAIHR